MYIYIYIDFSIENTKFCRSLHHNGNEIHLYVNKMDIYKFNEKDNISWKFDIVV